MPSSIPGGGISPPPRHASAWRATGLINLLLFFSCCRSLNAAAPYGAPRRDRVDQTTTFRFSRFFLCAVVKVRAGPGPAPASMQDTENDTDQRSLFNHSDQSAGAPPPWRRGLPGHLRPWCGRSQRAPPAGQLTGLLAPGGSPPDASTWFRPPHSCISTTP